MSNSIKSLVVISLVIVFLPFIAGSCANAQAGEVLTDKAVLTQLEKQSGKKFSKDDVCIKRLKESAEIVVIGLKGEDAICRYNGVFVDSRYFEKGNLESSKTALSSLGWEKANEQKREKLAKLWVEKGLLVFTPLTNQTLSAIPNGDGKIKVNASSKYPPGVTSRTVTNSFVFGADGGLFSGGDY